jgi:hypothetical protein
MSYAALDRVRIREAELGARGVRIVADVADAYPGKAGVKAFSRSFAWDGDTVFTVTDDVSLAEPNTVEWHLQSDTPFRDAGGRYRNGGAGDPALEVFFTQPKELAIEVGRATVKSPGPPGSIEKGPEEERGYRLTATAAAATSARFEVRLSARARP